MPKEVDERATPRPGAGRRGPGKGASGTAPAGFDDSSQTLAIERADGARFEVQRVALSVVAGPDLGKTFEARGERVVIGTHASADFALSDPTVSRLHCELEADKGRVLVRDLDSRNGTLVDGVPVLVAPLRPGGTLTLGQTALRLEAGRGSLALPISERDRFGLMIGTSPSMRRTFSQLERVAQSEVTVLLEGETGTGKELAAESLHRESARRDGPFIVVDCGSIPPELLESELFGHERGAFTGAISARDGAFLEADGGTIFLDEIGELPLDLQPKLLRALESRTVKRVGQNRQRPIDVRVIAASHRDFQAEVNARRFRADLYYRLAVVRIRLPPLRERTEDLALLVDHLLGRLLTKVRAPEALAFLREPTFLDALRLHRWPGNVRELRNYLERCVALREPSALGDELSPSAASEASIDVGVPLKLARERSNEAFERRYLERLLEVHADNVSAAARAAEIDRVHLHRLLRKHGLRGEP